MSPHVNVSFVPLMLWSPGAHQAGLDVHPVFFWASELSLNASPVMSSFLRSEAVH